MKVFVILLIFAAFCIGLQTIAMVIMIAEMYQYRCVLDTAKYIVESQANQRMVNRAMNMAPAIMDLSENALRVVNERDIAQLVNTMYEVAHKLNETLTVSQPTIVELSDHLHHLWT